LHLAIGGMQGRESVAAVEDCLRRVPGVESVRASYPPGHARITFRGAIDIQDVRAALRPQGLSAKPMGLEYEDASLAKRALDWVWTTAASLISRIARRRSAPTHR
jgi:copper chaperone CopZ